MFVNKSARTVPDTSPFTITVYDSFTEAQPLWQAFESDGMGYVFQNHDWLLPWFEHIGTRARLRPYFVAVEHVTAGRLMFLPLALDSRLGARRLTWLGGRHADYHGPLLGQGWALLEGKVDMAALWREIRARLPAFDALHFEKQPATIAEWPNPFLDMGGSPHVNRAFAAILNDSWASTYARRRSAKSRSTDRRKLRKLHQAGTVSLRLDIRDPAETERIMERLAALKSQQLEKLGARDLFSAPGSLDFYLALAKQGHERMRVMLSALELDGEVIAAHWGAVLDNRFYWLVPAYDEAYAACSPGLHLMQALIEWCCDSGIAVFDFSIGEEAYKFKWVDRTLPLYDHMEAVGPLGIPYILRTRLHLRSNQLIRRSPALAKIKAALRRMRAAPKRLEADEPAA